jgi:hypothetical protein
LPLCSRSDERARVSLADGGTRHIQRVRRGGQTPTWQLCLVQGAPFGLCIGAQTYFGHHRDSLTSAVVAGIVEGVVFGVFMGLFFARRQRKTRAVMGSVSADVERASRRALLRGPIPSDLVVLTTALRLGRHALAQPAGHRRLARIVLGLFVVLGVAIAMTSRFLGSWLIPLMFAATLVASWRTTRNLKRRVSLLESAVRTAGASVDPA